MKHSLPILVLVSCVLARAAFADTLVTNTFGSPITPAVTCGYAFMLTRDVLVSSVGIYDASGNGLVGTNKLGIWKSDGSLISTNIFDGTTSTTLIGHFRWLPLSTPIVLAANTPYWIGTFGPAQGLQGAVGSGALSPDIKFIAQVGSSSGSFTFPNSATNRTSGSAYIGPNLQFTPIPKLGVVMTAATQLSFSWPTNAPGYILESTSVLPYASWNTVSNAPIIVGNQFVVEIASTNAHGFFRLRFQP